MTYGTALPQDVQNRFPVVLFSLISVLPETIGYVVMNLAARSVNIQNRLDRFGATAPRDTPPSGLATAFRTLSGTGGVSAYARWVPGLDGVPSGSRLSGVRAGRLPLFGGVRC